MAVPGVGISPFRPERADHVGNRRFEGGTDLNRPWRFEWTAKIRNPLVLDWASLPKNTPPAPSPLTPDRDLFRVFVRVDFSDFCVVLRYVPVCSLGDRFRVDLELFASIST